MPPEGTSAPRPTPKSRQTATQRRVRMAGTRVPIGRQVGGTVKPGWSPNQGAIRALCFQLVTDPELPVTAGASSTCPFRVERSTRNSSPTSARSCPRLSDTIFQSTVRMYPISTLSRRLRRSRKSPRGGSRSSEWVLELAFKTPACPG